MSIKKELITFSIAWQNKPPSQIAEEFASLSMETNRIPDPYSFVYDSEGKLVSPQTGRRVEDSIEKESELGKLEYQGFLLVEHLGWLNTEGIIVWISPPHVERSKSTKIVLTEIENNAVKKLVNKAIIIDMDEKACIALANKLEPDYVYTNTSQLRRRPILVKDFDLGNLNDSRQVEIIRNREDVKVKKEALIAGNFFAQNLISLSRNSPEALFESMLQQSIFGEFEMSCPPTTAFESFYKNSKVVESKRILCCTCPFCKEKVEAEIYEGKIHCPRCRKEADWAN